MHLWDLYSSTCGENGLCIVQTMANQLRNDVDSGSIVVHTSSLYRLARFIPMDMNNSIL